MPGATRRHLCTLKLRATLSPLNAEASWGVQFCEAMLVLLSRVRGICRVLCVMLPVALYRGRRRLINFFLLLVHAPHLLRRGSRLHGLCLWFGVKIALGGRKEGFSVGHVNGCAITMHLHPVTFIAIIRVVRGDCVPGSRRRPPGAWESVFDRGAGVQAQARQRPRAFLFFWPPFGVQLPQHSTLCGAVGTRAQQMVDSSRWAGLWVKLVNDGGGAGGQTQSTL